MYQVVSDLPKMEYISELKNCFGSPFMVFDERITGLVIGPFFSVAHHTDYEWDRRYNSLTNRAWGWVKTNPIDGQTEVNFIRGFGMFSPSWVIFFACLIPLLMILADPYILSEDMIMICVLGVIGSLIVCASTSIGVIMSDRGAYGAGEITKLLSDPKSYYC